MLGKGYLPLAQWNEKSGNGFLTHCWCQGLGHENSEASVWFDWFYNKQPSHLATKNFSFYMALF